MKHTVVAATPTSDTDAPPMPLTGYLHSVESGAAVDGPGMRFVFFLSGCQFRCLYCHNPDTWKLHNGRVVTVGDCLLELAPYAKFLKFAGGVTVSGGEPLMQAEFVGALFEQIKKQYGLHTALDTQGFLHANVTDDWFDSVDLVLLDIKEMDPVKYERITTKPLQPTLDFARRLVRLNKKMWIRYVLVPGLSDDEGDIGNLADFIASELMLHVERVEVLPFHQLGSHKWADLGMKYELADTPTPTPGAVRRAREIFAARGLKVT